MAGRRMRNGQLVTEEVLADLVREAEAGYAPGQVRSPRLGRPPLGEGASRVVKFRVDAATYDALIEQAENEDRGVSELVRLALEHYLVGDQRKVVNTPSHGEVDVVPDGTDREIEVRRSPDRDEAITTDVGGGATDVADGGRIERDTMSADSRHAGVTSTGAGEAPVRRS